ncbi:hypothetical protein SAMN05216360_11770 [Methylobacterium phyllostachyos]|uniref:Uncharacterized protein n=1 Tax=Methylobacterium phyllostachyos TaxID=582672 RepID=A0A1H0HYA6_9HYPH|nr:hypothetical protein [Methylobacterium phyllostachyos]SDO24125.1 hypothetical protein SAMN05216360_11770 [Methylobacterium phyllostachyos]
MRTIPALTCCLGAAFATLGLWHAMPGTAARAGELALAPLISADDIAAQGGDGIARIEFQPGTPPAPLVAPSFTGMAQAQGLTITPPAGQSYGFILNQTLSGTSSKAVSGSYLGVTDTGRFSSAATTIAWNQAHTISGVSGHRTSYALTTTFSGADDGTTPNPYYVAFIPTMNVTAGDNGTHARGSLTYASGRGAYFATNPILKASHAPNLQELSNTEMNIGCDATCSVAYKSILSLVSLSGDKTPGTIKDDMLTFSANAGAVGFKYVINVSGAHGQVPFNAGSTILKAAGGTLLNGIDLSGLTITGNTFASPGFTVTGTGTVLANYLYTSANSIQIGASKTPASSTAACAAGQISWDAGHIYVCVATNTWKRSALATW